MSSTISLSDQTFLEPLFKNLASPCSDYTFANCYLFRNVHQYQVQGNFLKGVTRDGFSYLMPLTFPFDIHAGPQFFPLCEKWLPLFPPDQFRIETLPQDNDYLFERLKLETYPGRKLAAQRNLLYQFERDYDPEQKPFSSEAAIEILEAWKKGDDLQDDYFECLEAIDKRDILGLKGLLFYSGKEPVSFLLAEKLLSDTYVVHFVKAKPHFKGAVPYLYRAFSQSLPPEIKCINLEQDLGLPNLEKAKQSYLPCTFIKKYRVIRSVEKERESLA